MKRIACAAALLLLCASLTNAQEALKPANIDAEGLFDLMQARLARFQTVRFAFEQTVSMMGQTTTSEGEGIFKRPHKNRIETRMSTPMGKTTASIISDGETVWQVVKMPAGLQQVRYDLSQMDDSAVARIGGIDPLGITNMNRFQETRQQIFLKFDMQVKGIGDASGTPVYVVDLSPRSGPQSGPMPPVMGRIRIRVGAEDGFVRAMDVYDKADKPLMQMTFKDLKFDVEATDSLFAYSPIPGVPVGDGNAPLKPWYDYSLSNLPDAKWVFTYPEYTPSEVGDLAEVRRTYAVLPADRYVLRLRGGDNYVSTSSGYHVRQVLVDGEAVWTQDAAGGERGMLPIQADVTEKVKGKTSVTVVLRVSDLKGVKNFGLHVWWSEVSAEGLKPVEGSVWTPRTQGKWQVRARETMQKSEIERIQKTGDPTAFLLQKEAPDFALKALDGTEISLKSLRGKAVLMDFWASWCGPCREALPHVQKMHEDFKGKGLVVLGINAESADAAQRFVKENHYTFTTLSDGVGKVSALYRVQAIPTTVIVDRDGIVRSYTVGYGPEEEMRAALAKAGVQ